MLVRKDIGTSYHIAVVVDDARQGVTHVVRGRDLFHATAIHRLLQHLLALPVPRYFTMLSSATRPDANCRRAWAAAPCVTCAQPGSRRGKFAKRWAFDDCSVESDAKRPPGIVSEVADDAFDFPVAEARGFWSLAAIDFFGKPGRLRRLAPRRRFGESTFRRRGNDLCALVLAVSHTHHIGAVLQWLQGRALS